MPTRERPAWLDEPEEIPTYHCPKCGKEGDWDEYYSFGVYAGRYCSDRCWRKSGYRDATDASARFDPMDAGEAMDEEDY